MLYGLEKEYFVLKKGVPITTPRSIPSDNCGYLAEARGKPFDNIREAVYSLLAEESRMKELVSLEKCKLVDVPIMKVPREVKLQAARDNCKEPIKFQNLYGYSDHAHDIDETPAGIHISFTVPATVYVGDKSLKYNSIWDYVHLFRYLDKTFEKEIKESKRLPGFYELKIDGRIEYRSLPNNIDLKKVISVIENYRS